MRDKVIRFRATEDDAKLLDKVGKKLGLDGSSVLRMALRKLAETEGMLKK